MASLKFTTISIFILATFALQCYAEIVCPENYCESIGCAAIVECPEGEALAPTACGCCKHCVTEIPRGDACLVEIGAPPKQVCANGTSCIDGICT